jgi:polynucleotide 5'-kinase involved in rRNA processing
MRVIFQDYLNDLESQEPEADWTTEHAAADAVLAMSDDELYDWLSDSVLNGEYDQKCCEIYDAKKKRKKEDEKAARRAERAEARKAKKVAANSVAAE